MNTIKNKSFIFAKVAIFVLLIVQLTALFIRNNSIASSSFSIIYIIENLGNVDFWTAVNNDSFRLMMTTSIFCAIIVNVFMFICLMIKDSEIFSNLGSVVFLLFAAIYALLLGIGTTNVGFYKAIKSFNMFYFVTLFLATILAAKIKANFFYFKKAGKKSIEVTNE